MFCTQLQSSFARILIILIVIAIVAGCSSTTKQSGTYRTADVPRLEVEHVMSIYEPEDDFIVYATAVGTTSDGDIIITDSENSRMMVFDSTGLFKQQIGRSGSGPGEFSNVADFVVSPDDKLYVPDRRQARTSVFHKQSGEWVLDRVLTHPEIGMFPVAVNGIEAVYRASVSQSVIPGIYGYKHWIAPAIIDSEIILGSKIDVIEQNYVVVQIGSNFSLTALPFSPKTLSVTDPNGRFYLSLLEEKTIRIYDTSLIQSDSIQINLEPVATTVAERDTILSRRNEIMRSLISANFPTHKALMESFFVDESGYFWLNTNDSPKYLVLNKDGNPIGSFDLPDGLTLLHVSDDRLYLTDYRSEQFSIEVYEVELNIAY